MAWFKYDKGIDALVSLLQDRLLYQDLKELADGRLLDWTHHRYVRTIGSHKQVREVEVTAAGQLASWDGFTEKAASPWKRFSPCWVLLRGRGCCPFSPSYLLLTLPPHSLSPIVCAAPQKLDRL